jgi:drug/metabolite transporter (DMT)-like permease
MKSYTALITGVLAVSTGAIFVRLADAPALVIAAYRVGIASLVLIPIALLAKRKELTGLSRRELALALVAGFCLALHFAAWISSLSYTSVANSVVLVNTNPIWVAICSPWITGDRIDPLTVVAVAGSVVGAVLIGFGDFASGGNALFGDFLAVIGSICAAMYLLLGRKLRQTLSLIGYVTLCYTAAAMFLWLMVFLMRLPVSGFSTDTWACFLSLALFTQLVGHTCYNWALKWFSTSLVAVSLLGEPIGSTILAYFLLGESLTGLKIVGGIFILSAIYLAAKSEKRRSPQNGSSNSLQPDRHS